MSNYKGNTRIREQILGGIWIQREPMAQGEGTTQNKKTVSMLWPQKETEIEQLNESPKSI